MGEEKIPNVARTTDGDKENDLSIMKVGDDTTLFGGLGKKSSSGVKTKKNKTEGNN